VRAAVEQQRQYDDNMTVREVIDSIATIEGNTQRPTLPNEWDAFPIEYVRGRTPLVRELADRPPIRCGSQPGMFEAFLRLAEVDEPQQRDEEVVRFAGKFGLLGLCRHGWPESTCYRIQSRAAIFTQPTHAFPSLRS
jgi:hypothetical protein